MLRGFSLDFGKARDQKRDGPMAANPEIARERSRLWRLNNPEKVKANSIIARQKRKEKWEEFLRRERERYAERRESVLARQSEYRERNREKVRAAVRKSYRKRPEAYVAACAKRKAAKLRATPAWADMSRIGELYRVAREISVATGVPHEVDHIEPLRGRTVCGLHVIENLRVVPRSENRRKGAKQIANNSDQQCRL